MAEPTQRRTGEDGGKFYEHRTRTEPNPDGGPGSTRPARYLSVTQALSVLAKPDLIFWSANLAAARAMSNLPQLIGALLVPDCGRAAARTEPYGCKVCEACIARWVALFHVGEKNRRAREGTATHDVLERWILTGEWLYTPALTGDADIDQYVPTRDAMAPYVAALQAWGADYALTPEDFLASECTVWNHRLSYAGTLDFIVTVHPRTMKAAELCARINFEAFTAVQGWGLIGETPPGLDGIDLLRPVTILGDAKSREGEKAQLYTEHPLQLTAYRCAETMTPKHGAEEMERPMMSTDGAAILQVRPDGYTFRPVVTDGRTMRAFEATLTASRWESEFGDYSTQVQAFPKPPGWTWAPPTADGDPVPPKPVRKRAPAKKAAAKAAPRTAGTSPLSDLRQTMQGARATISDDDIPF